MLTAFCIPTSRRRHCFSGLFSSSPLRRSHTSPSRVTRSIGNAYPPNPQRTVLCIFFYHSFWSIFDRGDGLLTLTAAVGFFYLILLYADKEFLRKLFSVAAWVGSLVAVYAVLQWLQSVSGMNIPVIAEPRGRFGATFGNAAFLAAYLGMTLF